MASWTELNQGMLAGAEKGRWSNMQTGAIMRF
jgi:hypothetical protein